MKRFLIIAGLIVFLCPYFFGEALLRAQAPETGGLRLSPEQSAGDLLPVLIITPREIDLGALGPGEEAKPKKGDDDG